MPVSEFQLPAHPRLPLLTPEQISLVLLCIHHTHASHQIGKWVIHLAIGQLREVPKTFSHKIQWISDKVALELRNICNAQYEETPPRS